MAWTECYCQTTGSNLNAGSTTSDTATHTYASGDWVAGTGVFTVASGDPASDGVAVGDWASVYADGSTVTGFVGRVTARDATTITVSLTAKSGTAPTDGTGNRTLKVGGAWQGPNAAVAFPFNFIQNTHTNASGDAPRVNFKSGTNYAITAAMTHGNAGPIRFEGYTSSAGDGGLATIDGGTGGSGYVPLSVTGTNTSLASLIGTNNGGTSNSAWLSVTAECQLERVVIHHCRGNGITANNGSSLIECEAYACNQNNSAGLGGISLAVATARRCISHDNTGSNSAGFIVAPSNNSLAVVQDCIADSNGGIGFFVTSNGIGGTNIQNCDSYGNNSDGIRLDNPSGARVYLENCNLIANGGYGINGSGAGTRNGAVVNCGFGSGTMANTSGATTGLGAMSESGSVTYAADAIPWVDPGNGDFRITLAAAKAAGRGTFTQTASGYTGTVAYPDIGAAQSRGGGITTQRKWTGGLM